MLFALFTWLRLWYQTYLTPIKKKGFQSTKTALPLCYSFTTLTKPLETLTFPNTGSTGHQFSHKANLCLPPLPLDWQPMSDGASKRQGLLMDGTCSSSEEINWSHGQGCAAKALTHGYLPGEGRGGVCVCGGSERRLPTICVWRGTAKRQSDFTACLRKNPQCPQIIHVISFKPHLATVFGKFQHHYVLIHSLILISAPSS